MIQIVAVVQAVEQGTTLGRVIPLPRKPHHADCPTQTYLDKQGILYGWNMERYGHAYHLTDRAFWRLFGPKAVPECSCKHRQIASNGHTELAMQETQPAFVLHFQHAITAPIVASLRHRIALCLVTTTGDFAFHFQDLGNMDGEQPGIEHALGRNAHEVLKRLREFEEHAAGSLRHRRHSSSVSQGSSRRKSSSSS